MTIRECITQTLSMFGEQYVTATDIKKTMGDEYDLASVSSILKKMCDEGVLERLSSVGPRGGYGYRVARIA